ncbi:MAG: endonuclease III [Verrucomicrobiales bacterium]|jgi:endonuclease-3|nr:endonuclease III [Verrucomicrobiales bacterium]|tara:strand:+ start:5743 stop:6408 length:666 start_codon:yes stop_codon:yes gene_type:complete
MPRESIKAKTERTAAIIYGLKRTYPNARCELDYSNPLELLVATILSAQCTDKQVNIVTSYLFKKYRCASDYIKVHLEELQDDIKRIGLFRNKSKSIQKCCHSLIDKHGGNVPADMKSLVALAGVGRKTANVVLGNAFNINEGVVVDTHVARLANRLGLTRDKAPEKIELNLQKLVPRNDWTMFSHWLIWHGRRRCSARKPDCSICEIATLCPSGKSGIYLK